jgi:anti-sigma B factor antagonist
MDFGIQTREQDGVVIMALAGKLLFGEACDTLRGQLKQAFASGKTKVVLNLEELGFVDSAGLGCIASCYATARRQGGLIMLVRPTGQVRKALAWTRISSIIKPFEDEQAALASSG